MAQKYYSQHKNVPLTENEIKEKYKEAQEEIKEVLKWKKEEEAKLENLKLSPQKKRRSKKSVEKSCVENKHCSGSNSLLEISDEWRKPFQSKSRKKRILGKLQKESRRRTNKKRCKRYA